MNKAFLVKNILSKEEHMEIKDFALYLYNKDKKVYDEGFGRYQWGIWDGGQSNFAEPLKKFHNLLLPKAREEFKSETLLPSWCLLSIYEGKNAKLWPHKDDNACTYHINYTVFHKTPWDFYVEGERFSPNENDAVLMYGNEQEHWRDSFPDPDNNLVCNAFFFYCEPDHWYFTKGQNYLYTDIRKTERSM